MQADYSVELGADAPALEIPWRSNDPHVRYYDLKKHPEMVQKIPEAAAYPELGAFLSRINVAEFPLATAKCDAWLSSEVSPEEEIFGDRKFVSYVDLVFLDESERCSFAKHESFAKELCRLLSQAPEIAATVELIIRHCYYHRVTNPCIDVAEIQDEPANVSDDAKPESEMRHIELSKAMDQDGQVIVSNHSEFAASAERKQSGGAQELDSSDLLHWDDSFKTELSGKTEQSDKKGQSDKAGRPGKTERWGETERSEKTERSDIGQSDKIEASGRTEQPGETGQWGKPEPLSKIEPSGKSRPAPFGESGNLQLEPMPHRDEFSSSITGFCLTAYVTGFGDCDHDPLRRWAIGLNLLQHAIVQLNSKL